ncbi:MAG: M23 family metallopeptidase [Thermoleophilia bacterium]|jgi:hypothetical protein|nr:M23 family metallopeptidase [Thermoleophilia bacterium]
MSSRTQEPAPSGAPPEEGLSAEQLASRRARRRAADRQSHRRLLTRVGAPAALAVLVVVALVLAARSGSGQEPPAPVADPVPSGGLAATPPARAVVMARIGRLDLRLPVGREQVTAVLFHPIMTPGGVPLTPADGLDHHTAGGDDGAPSAGVDVGAPVGTTVYSPVDGVVTAVIPFRVQGRPEGLEIALTPNGLPDVVVRVAHIEPTADGVVPEVGQAVGAGRTVLGRVRDLSRISSMEIARYTADAGNHVAIEVVRLASG